LSLRLLVNEDLQGKLLLTELRATGHDVVSVREAGLSGKHDRAVLDYAVVSQRILLTGNCADFSRLSERMLRQGHHGILLLYKYNNPTKDLT
jgi:predicted nuclease of predicted toxin-antitoxin system